MATQIDHFINSRSRGLDPVVIVEDAIMGTGKSSGIIKEFQAQCQVGTQFNRPVIVVLRYLDEITRFKKECPAMNWHEPSDTKGKKKEDIKTLLSMGYNILTTHKLFDAWDVEIRDAIFLSKYKIVIDEVVTCLESVDITPTALQEAEKAGLIRVQEQGKHKEVIWIGATDTYDGAFENLKRKCSEGTVLAHTVDNELLQLVLWSLPSDFFKLSNNYRILTYGFEYSYMAAYFKLTGIKYDICYPQLKRQKMLKEQAVSLIKFIDAPKSLTKHIASDTSFSHRWYFNSPAKVLNNISEVVNNNLRRRGVKLGELAYACPKTYSEVKYQEDGKVKKNIRLKSYGNYTIEKEVNGVMQEVDLDSYLSWAMLGTNMYSHCTTGAYLHNVFANVGIITFLQSEGIEFDEDAYATHCLVQWIWRLAIRKGEAIELMILNPRMRNLLNNWLSTNTQSGIPEGGCMVQYKLLSPTGRLYAFTNISEFCKCHSLDRKNIAKLLKGQRKSCKGWTTDK